MVQLSHRVPSGIAFCTVLFSMCVVFPCHVFCSIFCLFSCLLHVSLCSPNISIAMFKTSITCVIARMHWATVKSGIWWKTWAAVLAAAEYSNIILDWLSLTFLTIRCVFYTFMSVLIIVKDHWHESVPFRKGSSVPEKASSGGSSKEPVTVRMEFPETWLWSDSVTGYH